MNWITKFIKPKIKSLFEKRSSKVEENLWTTCSCKNLIYKEDFHSNFFCCPKCGAHHKLSCKDRFKSFFDNGLFETIETPLPIDDPLNFEDNKKYKDRLKTARKKTHRTKTHTTQTRTQKTQKKTQTKIRQNTQQKHTIFFLTPVPSTPQINFPERRGTEERRNTNNIAPR